jgi:hypothetical protein
MSPVSPASRWAVSLIAVAAAAALGWAATCFLGGRDAKAPTASGDRVVASGPFRLTVDRRWQPREPPRWLAATGLRDVRAFSPIAAAPPSAWFGHASIPGPRRAPAGLRAVLASRLPPARGTVVAGRRGWLYRSLQTIAGEVANVAILPAGDGAVVVGCSGPRAWWPAAANCELGVRAIQGRLPGTLGAAHATRRAVTRLIATLNRRRLAAARRLHQAHDRRAQAAAARAIARSLTAAGRELSSLRLDGVRDAVGALGNGAHAYGALAGAAQAGRSSRYARAARRVARADRAISRRLASLRPAS